MNGEACTSCPSSSSCSCCGRGYLIQWRWDGGGRVHTSDERLYVCGRSLLLRPGVQGERNGRLPCDKRLWYCAQCVKRFATVPTLSSRVHLRVCANVVAGCWAERGNADNGGYPSAEVVVGAAGYAGCHGGHGDHMGKLHARKHNAKMMWTEDSDG
jgi:hypothetical protein